MIDDEDYSSFKFNGDDEPEPEPEQTLYQEEARDRRIEKISHRVTIISILIPVLLGVVFYITYRDITTRVSQSQDTGAMEIQNLSTQLEDQFEALSKKYGELETSLAQKLAALEKVDKSMKVNLKKAQEMVSKINATKVDKKNSKMPSPKSTRHWARFARRWKASVPCARSWRPSHPCAKSWKPSPPCARSWKPSAPCAMILRL